MELRLPTYNITKTRLKIVNCFINNLTDIELDIISKMIDGKLYRLDRNTRSQLRSSLNMNKYIFNNYIKYLKDKGALKSDKDNVLMINPSLIKLTADDKITIELYKKEDNAG